MKLALRNGRLTAWIAIFALLLAALSPNLTRVLAAPQQAMPWADICTVAGTQTADDVAPLSGSGQHEGGAFKHCVFCLNHAGHFALATAPLQLLATIGATAEAIPHFAARPFPRPIRAAAQPRAPPHHS
ncbi:MAG: DUF2946 family protein [Sulfuritalea sp.]|nr:DUF2946 family protein [Sulfuritalea sp.]